MAEFPSNYKTKVKWALKLADRGIHILPVHYTHPDGSCSCGKPKEGEDRCRTPGKHPMGYRWEARSSVDHAKIKKWFEDDPFINYGLHARDTFCFGDADMKECDGWQAMANLVGMTVAELKASTFCTMSPSGGGHLYWKATKAYGNTSRSKLGPGLDTRGGNGQILGPGSGNYLPFEDEFGETFYLFKEYTVITDAPFADLPAVIEEKLSETTERVIGAEESLYPGWIDHPALVEFYRERLRRRAPAIEGEGGNNHTYVTLLLGRDLNLSRATAMEVLREDGGWNSRCEPPWEGEEFEDLADNAFSYGKGKFGAAHGVLLIMADALGLLEEGAGGVELEELLIAAAKDFDSCFNTDLSVGKPISSGEVTPEEMEAENLASAEFIFGYCYAYGILSLLAAPGGWGKTKKMLRRFILVACGLRYLREIAKTNIMLAALLACPDECPLNEDPLMCWYWNTEDSRADILLAVLAACKLYGIDQKVVFKNLDINGSEDRVKFAKVERSGAVTMYTPNVHRVAARIIRRKVRLFGVEPFVRLFDVPSENDNTAMDRATTSLTLMGVDLTHKLNHPVAIASGVHTVKVSGKDIEEFLKSGPRGAGSQADAARLVEQLAPMHDGCNVPGIKKEDYGKYIYTSTTKSNFTDKSRTPFFETIVSEEMPAYKGATRKDMRKVGVMVPAMLDTVPEEEKKPRENVTKEARNRQAVLAVVAAQYGEKDGLTEVTTGAAARDWRAAQIRHLVDHEGYDRAEAGRKVKTQTHLEDAIRNTLFPKHDDTFTVAANGRALSVTWIKGRKGRGGASYFTVKPSPIETVEDPPEVPVPAVGLAKVSSGPAETPAPDHQDIEEMDTSDL